jgi:hypothetical protein
MSKLLLCSSIIVLSVSFLPAESHDNQTSTPTSVGSFSFWGPCVGVDNCTYFFGDPGYKAGGSGNFSTGTTGAPSVSYYFVTGLPLSWSDTGYSYTATFGLGGSFQMTLPNGLTFTGMITSGSAGSEGFTSEIQVYYAGRWSDGQYATGSVYEYQLGGSGPVQSLIEQASPGKQY